MRCSGRQDAYEHRAERRLHWILGVALGLILGYAWGQYDAHTAPTWEASE